MYTEPQYGDIVQRLEAARTAWCGDSPRAEAFVNEAAPVIKQPNVPSRGDGHRQQVEIYCKTAMERYGVV